MRCIADGAAYTAPATIDDPKALEEIGAALGALGYAKAK
jgi:propionyl-CoA synthetase